MRMHYNRFVSEKLLLAPKTRNIGNNSRHPFGLSVPFSRFIPFALLTSSCHTPYTSPAFRFKCLMIAAGDKSFPVTRFTNSRALNRCPCE